MLYLKMACTTLKVSDDCAMMCMHGFSFWRRNTASNLAKFQKGFKKGQVDITSKQGHQELQCT